MAGRPLPTSGNAPSSYVPITPSDTTRLEGFQYLRIGGAGNLLVKGVEPGAVFQTIAVAAGEYFPFGAGYVGASTAATSIVGIGGA